MKNISSNFLFLILWLLACKPLSAIVTDVYNLRIAQTTRRQTMRQATAAQNRWIAAALFIDQYRKFPTVTSKSESAMAVFIYTRPSHYFEIDAAFGHVHTHSKTAQSSATQTDDILFSAGWGNPVGERGELTVSGYLGIPTHNDRNLEHAQFGTGHVGLGAQFDGAYRASDRSILFGAVRWIHFFPRSTCLLGEKYKFWLGNTIDWLFAYDVLWNKNRFEVGYNPTFLFRTKICPQVPLIPEEIDFIRSSLYMTYCHRFLTGDKPSAIILGFSASHDHKPKQFGLRYGFTPWVAYGINF